MFETIRGCDRHTCLWSDLFSYMKLLIIEWMKPITIILYVWNIIKYCALIPT